jgi:hypothetical protein
LNPSLTGPQRYGEAKLLLLQGYDGLVAPAANIPAQRNDSPAEAAARIVPLYKAWGKPAKAAKWRKRLQPER